MHLCGFDEWPHCSPDTALVGQSFSHAFCGPENDALDGGVGDEKGTQLLTGVNYQYIMGQWSTAYKVQVIQQCYTLH